MLQSRVDLTTSRSRMKLICCARIEFLLESSCCTGETRLSKFSKSIEPITESAFVKVTFCPLWRRQGVVMRMSRFFYGPGTQQFLDTFKEFPARQRAASFSIDQAVDAMKKGLGHLN
jgi:hypothetical protein